MKFPPRQDEVSTKQLDRVREICSRLPDTVEKLSHGEPTFFVNNRVYVMFANNHHSDGYVAIWVPVPEGLQEQTIQADPVAYFFPPYVGKQGWVGIDLTEIGQAELQYHVETAWTLKKMATARRSGPSGSRNPP